MRNAVELKDLMTIESSKQEIKAEVKPRTVQVTEDAELHGVGKGLGAVVGGGAAMAFTAYLACLFLLPYIQESVNFLTGFLIAIVSYMIVALGALAGYKVVEWVEKRDQEN